MSDLVKYQLLIHASGKKGHSKYAQAELSELALNLPENENVPIPELAVIVGKSVKETEDWIAAHNLHKQHEESIREPKNRNEKNFTLWQRFLASGIYDDSPAAQKAAYTWWSDLITNNKVVHTATIQPKLIRDVYLNATARQVATNQGILAAAELVAANVPSVGVAKVLTNSASKFNKFVPAIKQSEVDKIRNSKIAMAIIISGFANYEKLYHMILNPETIPVPVKRPRGKGKATPKTMVAGNNTVN